METKYVKYPRTHHLPWSVGTKDDKTLKSDKQFEGKRVIASIKMDGENTSIYNDKTHARSLDSESHLSQSLVKALQGEIGWLLDEDMRVCGENVYAKHTIKYTTLKSYFYGFSFWKKDKCYDWDETLELFELLKITPVEVFYDGIYDTEEIKRVFEEDYPNDEGYVVRLAESFTLEMFGESMGKYVRPEFRQAVDDSDIHWKQAKIEKNELVNTKKDKEK